MARILVLREFEEAERTGRRLSELGHVPILLPVERTRRLDTPPPPGKHAGFAATSARAVVALARWFADDPRPLFAVGRNTAAAASSAGFADVRVAGPDASSLGDAVARSGLSDAAAILYAAGRPRTATLEEALAARRVPFDVWETYQIVPLRPTEAEIAGAFRGGTADFVLVFSVGQAEALSALVESATRHLDPLPVPLALSARIVAALPERLRAIARISHDKSVDSLFAGLDAPK